MPRPPCCAEHAPSLAPAITGPPQNVDVGPLHAQVASDQQCERPVSTDAMPASSTPLGSPAGTATSRMCSERGRRAAPDSSWTSAATPAPSSEAQAGSHTAVASETAINLDDNVTEYL